MKLNLGFGSYTPYSIQPASRRLVNLFPEMVEQDGGKSRTALYGTPGLTTRVTLADSTTGLIKALFYDTFTGRMFAVKLRTDASVRLSELTTVTLPFDTETDRGQLAASGGTSVPASISSNGTQLLIINPESTETAHSFVLATNTLASETADIGNQEPRWGQFLDGYFIALDNNGKIYLSALNDGTTWDVLDVATPESSPDKARMILADHNELAIFGDESVEFWYIFGTAAFPFKPVKQATIQEGVLFPYSVAAIDNAFFYVARGRNGRAIVRKVSGYRPERVSTHAVESSIQNLGTISGASPVAWTYQIHGHNFYKLTFPSNSLTWVYDVSLPPEIGWHEEVYLNGSTEEAHRGRCGAYAGGVNGAADAYLVGDRGSGKIYITSMDVYTDAGDSIRREIRTQHLSNELKRMFFDRIELEVEPQAGTWTLEESDTGGSSFGTAVNGAANYSNKQRKTSSST